MFCYANITSCLCQDFQVKRRFVCFLGNTYRCVMAVCVCSFLFLLLQSCFQLITATLQPVSNCKIHLSVTCLTLCHLCACLSHVCLSHVCLSVTCLFVCHLSVCHLFVGLSDLCLSVTCLSVNCLPVTCMSITCLYVCLIFCLPVWLSTCLSLFI